MSKPNSDREREEQAIDAIIAASFNQDPCIEDAVNIDKYKKALWSEDHQALDELGSDFVEQLFSGEGLGSSRVSNKQSHDLATALNRAEEGSELTKKAKEEMERKMREAIGRDEEEL